MSAALSDFTDAAFKLGTSIAGGKGSVRDAAEQLGLQWRALRTMSPDEQFNAVTRALEGMENPQERNRLALELFGKGASKVIPAIVEGFQKLAAGAAVASDAQIHALDEAGAAWDAFVARQKKGLTSWLGNQVIARDTVDKLTNEQRAKYLALLKTGGDAQGFLLEMAAKMRAAVDVNLKVEAPKPIPESFVASLKAAEAGYRDLSVSKRADLQAALDLHKTDDDIINQLHLVDGVLDIAKKRYEEQKAAIAKTRSEAEAYAKVVAEVQQASIPLTLEQRAQVVVLEHLGVSTSKIAAYLEVTEAQVSTFTDSLKQNAKALAEVGKQINAIPRNVSLRLQTENLAGAVPMIDVDAVKKASGAVKRISDATFGDIEGRMRVMGVFTKAELVKMAATATEQYESMRASGKFSAEEIQAAWERMTKANLAVTAAFGGTVSAGLRNLALSIPKTLEQGFTGGGGAAGAMKAIGVQLADLIVTPVVKGLGRVQQSALAAGSAGATALGGSAAGGMGATVAGLASSLGGAALAASSAGTAMAGAGMAGAVAMSAATMGIGAAAVGAAMLIKHFTSTAGRDAITKWVKENFGTFDNLQQRMLILGDDYDRLWKKLTQQTGKGDKAGAAAVMAEIAQALEAAEKKQAAFNASIHDMLVEVQGLGGGLSDTVRAYFDELERGGKLTQENLDLLHQLAGAGADDWHAVEAAVGRYNGKIEELPGTFQGARLHDSWQQVIDDMDLFERKGVSAGDALALTKDKIIELALQSQTFGTEIPENMRLWLQRLDESGGLLDENGKRIIDIDKLTFGETLQTTIAKLTDSIKALIEAFNKVPQAINAIPGTVDVEFRGRRTGQWPENTREGEEAVPMAAGGFGTVTRPTLFLAGEAGREDYAFSGAGRGFGGMQRPIVIENRTYLDGRVVAKSTKRHLGRELLAAASVR